MNTDNEIPHHYQHFL